MVYSEGTEQSSVDSVGTPALAKPILLCTPVECVGDDHEIEVGCIYEINHINLPPSTPARLKSINVALVSEKSAVNVTLRFPSVKSINTYFNSCCTVDRFPDFDEEFLMGKALASRVLHCQVPFDEVLQMKCLRTFWFVDWFISWGINRPLNYVGEHEQSNSASSSSSSTVQGDESPKEMVYLEGTEQINVGTVGTPALARDVCLPLLRTSVKCIGDDHEIEVGCFYEINHINLPPCAPAELKFINVALVSEKSAVDVTLRFPSVKSVKTYFNIACTVHKYPDFDEEFLMGTALACRVLRCQVPFDEILQRKSLRCFWFVGWFIIWGINRPLNFVGEYEQSNSTNSSSSSVQGDESPRLAIEEEEEGAGEESEYEISDEAIKQDDEAEENGDEEADTTEAKGMVYLEGTEQINVGSVGTPALARDVCLPLLRTSFNCIGDDHEIEVFCFYEINHINLPSSAPAQLKFIDVALVSEKSAVNVTLRFPSVKSVKTYFNSACTVHKYPDFDEEFLMGTALASRVLRRQVPFEEVLQKKDLQCFWFVGWFVSGGINRPLNFVGEHEQSNSKNSSSSSVQGDESPRLAIEEEEGAGEESENEISNEAIKQDDEAEENGDEEADATEEANVNLKRKRYTSLRSAMKKAKVGMPYNPIPELKLKTKLLEDIEDPAQVDQVLEELDGELLPGGTQRLCWRRNAEGIMEYWLEDANLVNNRKEAGVNDPYWVPPPGWRLRDCSTQQISILKREVQIIAQSQEEFRKEVRAVMEVKFSMFSTLLAEIKKNQLVEKET